MTHNSAFSRTKEINALIRKLKGKARAPARWADGPYSWIKAVRHLTGMPFGLWMFFGISLPGVFIFLGLSSSNAPSPLVGGLFLGALATLSVGGWAVEGFFERRTTHPPHASDAALLAESLKDEPLLLEVFEAWMRKTRLGSITAWQTRVLLGALKKIEAWREYEGKHEFARSAINQHNDQILDRIDAEKQAERMARELPEGADSIQLPSSGRL